MKTRRLLASALLSVIPLLAHHSWAGLVEFDTSKKVTISGTITKVEFANPHVLIYFDVRNANGTVTNWVVEAPPPNTLKRAGLTQVRLAQGATITTVDYVATDGSPKANSNNLRLADGQGIAIIGREFI
jgi:hypothetical protein